MRPQTRAMLLALSRRGEAGVSAMDALFELHIYRAGARIYELRREGFQIRTERTPGQTATYVLEAVEPEPAEIADYAGNTFATITAADGMSVATSLWIEDAEFIVELVNAALPMAATERPVWPTLPIRYGHDDDNPECMCEGCRSIAAEDNS